MTVLPGIQRQLLRLIPVLLCLLITSLQAAPLPAESPLVADEGIGRYDLAAVISYARDDSRDWTIDQLTGGLYNDRFQRNTRDVLSFGYVDAVYWLRFRVASTASIPTRWLVEISGLGRSIDRIDAYLPDANGELQHQVSGDSVPFSQRRLQHHAVLLPFTLPARQPCTLYIRVQTNGTLQIPATLWSETRYLEQEHNGILVEGLFCGVLVIMIFYNGFIYLSTRDESYFIYVCYLVCVLMFAVSLNGIGFEYLWPEETWWNNNSNLIFAELGVLFVLLFARSFLKTPQLTQWINLIIGFLALCSIALFPVVVLASHRIAASILSVQYVLTVVFVVIAASLCLKRGFTAARYYLLAWLGVLVSILLWVLNSSNVIHSSWVGAYSFEVGTTIQVMLFSFALADRINLLRAERESALKLQLAHSKRLVSMAQMFEKFVPKQFLSRIAKEGIENIQLGKAEADDISVLFADIRGFTSLSESLTPQELLNFLNACFTRLDRVIHQHEGFIDKFMGDGVMALFEQDHHALSARNAVVAAIDMHAEVTVYNQHRANSGYAPIDIGIGINTGSVIIGTVGSSERMDSTVLGDSVNVASRLQELTKQFGVKIVISEHTRHALGDDARFQLRELGEVAVRGRRSRVRVYEVLNADSEEVAAHKLASLPLHNQALGRFRAGEWAAAAQLWRQCLDQFPGDTVSQHFLSECLLRSRAAERPEPI